MKCQDLHFITQRYYTRKYNISGSQKGNAYSSYPSFPPRMHFKPQLLRAIKISHLYMIVIKFPGRNQITPKSLTRPSPIHPFADLTAHDCVTLLQHLPQKMPASFQKHSSFCPCTKWPTTDIPDPTFDLRYQQLKCRGNAEPEFLTRRYKMQWVQWIVMIYKFIRCVKLYTPYASSLLILNPSNSDKYSPTYRALRKNC